MTGATIIHESNRLQRRLTNAVCRTGAYSIAKAIATCQACYGHREWCHACGGRGSVEVLVETTASGIERGPETDATP